MNDETAKRTVSRDILSFAIKAFIAAIAVVFVLSWIIDDIHDSVTDTINNLTFALHDQKIGGSQFWSKVEKGLDDAAAAKLPPEKKQKLLNDVRVIVARYRPFVDAVQDGLKDTSPATAH